MKSNEYIVNKYTKLYPPSDTVTGYKYSAKQKLSYVFRALRGVVVYYICDDAGKCISNLFLKKNYVNKYSFVKDNDVLINPYWTAPTERNKGLAKQLIHRMVMDGETEWKSCYAVVTKDNIASIRCLEQSGFQREGYAVRKIWSYRLTKNENSLVVYSYRR